MRTHILRKWLMCGTAIAGLGMADAGGALAEDRHPFATPRFEILLEGRFLQNAGAQQVWAESGFVSSGTDRGPFTEHMIRPGDALSGTVGLRLGLGRNSRWDLKFAYTGLRSSANNAAISGGSIGPIPTFLNLFLMGAYRYANIDMRMSASATMNEFDFEAGYDVGLGSGARMRLFGGLQIVQYRQKVTVTGTQTGFMVPERTQEKRTRYTGFGPQLGATLHVPVHKIGRSSIFVSGTLSGGMTIGRESDLIDHTTFIHGNVPNFKRSRTKVVYTMGAKLGLSWVLPGRDASAVIGFG